jgi:hypothetical protein
MVWFRADTMLGIPLTTAQEKAGKGYQNRDGKLVPKASGTR